VTHFPTAKRPFYVMDDPHNPRETLSFDLLFRGLEITTGGQRIHDYDAIIKKMEARGMDPEELASQLCRYYDERNREDVDRLPKVTRRNVLILKYYSFENYFFNPAVMVRLGIVESEDAFYGTLYGKWREYLYRIRSGQQLLGRDFSSPEDMKDHMEEVRTYLRGHNLYDIFYGPFKEREKEILRAYIDLAPREDFKDILDAIDRFVYFDSRKRPGDK
jgi:putative ATP-dependent endonuclease of OLD family